MIKYITCATAILALIGINSVAAIRSNNDSKWQHGLRKLYYSKGHEVTDVQTKCEQVIEGDPKKCIIVCVEITSIRNEDELVGEYSKVNQRECEAGWEQDGHDGNDVDWEGHPEWPTYSPTQFLTFYSPELADDGHDADNMWTGDGHDRVIDWTDNGSTSYTEEILVAGGSKGSKSDGYSKGLNGGYSKSSKSKGGKGCGQSKSSKLYFINNVKGGGGSGYSKSSKSSGVGNVGDWDATILEPIHDESEASSWFGGAGIIEGDEVSSLSKSSKSQSARWSSGTGVIKEGSGSSSGSSKSSKPTTAESANWSGGVGGSSKSSKPRSGSGSGSDSSKSSKLVADSGKWESAEWFGGVKGSGTSKSSKPAGGSADVLDGNGSISDGESGGWS